MAKPAQIQELAPASTWNIDRGGKSCSLSRKFGSEANPLFLIFERFAPGDPFQLVIVSNELKSLSAWRKLSIEYGVGGYVHDVSRYMAGTTAAGMANILIPNSSREPSNVTENERPAVRPETETAIREISLAQPDGTTLVIKTGSLGGPFAELRKCTDGLVRSWGLDPDHQRSLSRYPQPKNDPRKWVTVFDYPYGALRTRKQGVVHFRLGIDDEGKPTECETPRSFADETLDKLSCKLLLQRATFEPARDTDGKPVASFYRNMVSWLIP